MSDQPSYFTCTLGQAALLRQSKPYQTIPAFIDYQAEHYPDLPAIGCYDAGPHLTAWPHHVLTFGNVQRCTRRVARHMRDVVGLPLGQTVALLWPSSVEFLFIWLGLMYSGYPVLLIAPQCSASAIASLCKASGVSIIINHDSYSELATDALAEAGRRGHELKSPPQPLQARVLNFLHNASFDPIYRAEGASKDVAYLHHTSGTSSGAPKPVPQTHHGGLVVLPRLDGRGTSTFTTTPLYHGGIADLFRAWTSNTLIWLFPGADMPITASNVIRCLVASDAAHAEKKAPAVGYFSSVPYVLQMLAADDRGLQHLKKMQMVGVGGAALPIEVGDDLVRHGVNLVSRYGSAECGFLLSSQRDYAIDKGWQYLRCDPAVETLCFEQRDGGLYELVVGKTWPHMAKRNRDGGAFATNDLFEPHPSLENAWRYHSRADSQLTLVTGKKFDPAPLEAAIAASSNLVADALVFGDGQAYPGVLLFRSSEAANASDEDIKGQLRLLIQKLNMDSQSHARIQLEMLIPMPVTNLEKSSKGTILRSIATERFSKDIEAAYAGPEDSLLNVPDSDLISTILGAVSSVIASNSEDLTPEADLFASGIDSVASIQIRSKLTQLLPKDKKLPLTVVQDYGTVKQLAEYILALRHDRLPHTHRGVKQEDLHMQMRRMVEDHCVLPRSNEPRAQRQNATLNSCTGPLAKEHTILLTGPTGTLGAHILDYLLTHATSLKIKHIYLLVRGSTAHAALARVYKALAARSLAIPSTFTDLVTVLPCELSLPSLGLEPSTYTTLTSQITHIYHLAWQVNFLFPLAAFAPHIASVRNLLALSLTCNPPPTFIFCSSTASVSHASRPIPERLFPADPAAAGPTGYAQSKWVAEQVCGFFGDAVAGRVHIVRVGQLASSTATGCWGGSEAYPLMLSASRALGEAPDLDAAARKSSSGGIGEEESAWVPVDVAARAFVELGFGAASSSSSSVSQGPEDADADTDPPAAAEKTVKVRHLLPKPTERHSTWSDILACILAAEPQAFRIVPVYRWLERLEALRESEDEALSSHPALQLAGFWREAYCGGVADGEGKSTRGRQARREGETAAQGRNQTVDQAVGGHTVTTTSGFEMSESLRAMPALEDRPAAVHLDAGYIAKCWRWIKENV